MAATLVLAFSCLLMVVQATVDVKVGMLNLAGDVPTPIAKCYLFPAAQIALDTVAQRLRDGDYQNFTMSLVNTNACCTRPVRSTGALAASMYMEQGVDAFLGPGLSSDMIPVADMAAYWNLPVVSGASTSTLLADKARFPTLVRTSASISTATAFMSASFKHFGWSKGVILRGLPSLSLYYSDIFPDSVYSALEADGITMVEVYVDQFSCVDEAIEKAVSMAKIVILSTSSVREIMVRAHRLGYTKGSHAFLHWSPQDFPTNAQFENLDTEAIDALKALLVMRMHIPATEEYREFQAELHARQLEMFGKEEPAESYFAATTHDAVLIYAQVINEMLADGKDNVRDGKAIAKKMTNRSFEGVTGNVHINENGDRYGICELLDMTDAAEGTFSVVGTFDEATQSVQFNDIHWPEGAEALFNP